MATLPSTTEAPLRVTRCGWHLSTSLAGLNDRHREALQRSMAKRFGRHGQVTVSWHNQLVCAVWGLDTEEAINRFCQVVRDYLTPAPSQPVTPPTSRPLRSPVKRQRQRR